MLFGHLAAYSHQNDLCEAIMCMFRISMHQMRTCITAHVVQQHQAQCHAQRKLYAT